MTKKNQMYFAVNPDAKHDEHLVDYHIDDIDLKFTTDAGVFSKLRVDYGSGVLIKAMKNVDFLGLCAGDTSYGWLCPPRVPCPTALRDKGGTKWITKMTRLYPSRTRQTL